LPPANKDLFGRQIFRCVQRARGAPYKLMAQPLESSGAGAATVPSSPDSATRSRWPAKKRLKKSRKANRAFLYVYNRFHASAAAAPTGTRGRTVIFFAFIAVAAAGWMIAMIALLAYLIFWLYHHAQCYRREAGVTWIEGPSHFESSPIQPRSCPNPEYATLQNDLTNENNKTSTTTAASKICLTSLTDSRSPSTWQRMVRCRDFDDLAREVTFPNFRRYADRQGYRFFDASALIDPTRPPAWSKILAVQNLLKLRSKEGERACDWVFWLDADILIMNSTIRLESLLPGSSTGIDLVVTHDRKFTANSGAWMVRNSEWSLRFLDEWWDMKGWVRRPGLSLSGDNAAFGHVIDGRLFRYDSGGEHGGNSKIAMPGRCNFNSFGVFMTRSNLEMIQKDGSYEGQEWYRSDKFYHWGDFIVHASGIDQKAAVLKMMASRAT